MSPFKEENKKNLNSSIDISSMLHPECSEEKRSDIIILSNIFRSSEFSILQPIVEDTFVDKLVKWGVNFIYNAKAGNNIGCVLLGDKCIDETKPIQLFKRIFNLNDKKQHNQFIDNFKKIIWMTYRENFTPLLYKEFAMTDKDMKLYTSDNGWGCTVRAGQMAVANGILRHLLNTHKGVIGKKEYDEIILKFWDNGKGSEYPFSIQNFYLESVKYNKLPGEWLDQSTVAGTLQKLNAKYKPYNIDIITFIDGAIYASEFKSKPEEFFIIESKDGTIQGKLVFVSLNLGLKSPELDYLETFKKLFNFPELIGIIGGRKNEALFFVGWQEDNFFFLDPHLVQVLLVI